jgi:hypothetical protein
MPGESARGALAAKIKRHVEEEEKVLWEYRLLSKQLEKGPLRFLIDHILEEEQLHHFLLISVVQWLEKPPQQGERPLPEGPTRDELIRKTTSLREHERETAEGCRSLIGQLPAQETELVGSLLEGMALDSEKHHRLLLAVERLIES